MKSVTRTLLLCSLVGACASAQADPSSPHAFQADTSSHRSGGRFGSPRPEVDPLYRAEVIDEGGSSLPVYRWDDQSYVLGTMGERYRIHVTNRSSRRVEAVVSVDGLEVVGGHPADLADSRGYILPPHGEVTIEGFRTSLEEVAAFRFSSVRDSYADRKGAGRNVGVIGVAFFPERERMVLRTPPVMPYGGTHGRASSRDMEESSAQASAPAAAPAPTDAPRAEAGSSGMGAADGMRAPMKKAERAGLGTEFGERHESSVRYTSFERESQATPASILELHYNDREGLRAMGIPLDPPRDFEDSDLRRTADPFPGNRFASPPPGDR